MKELLELIVMQLPLLAQLLFVMGLLLAGSAFPILKNTQLENITLRNFSLRMITGIVFFVTGFCFITGVTGYIIGFDEAPDPEPAVLSINDDHWVALDPDYGYFKEVSIQCGDVTETIHAPESVDLTWHVDYDPDTGTFTLGNLTRQSSIGKFSGDNLPDPRDLLNGKAENGAITGRITLSGRDTLRRYRNDVGRFEVRTDNRTGENVPYQLMDLNYPGMDPVKSGKLSVKEGELFSYNDALYLILMTEADFTGSEADEWAGFYLTELDLRYNGVSR